MADVVEAFPFVQEEKDKLPEELAQFVGLGFDNNNHLVGLEEGGGTKQIKSIGQTLVHLAINAGLAEEVPAEEESPAVAALKGRVLELEDQLRSEKEDHDRKLNELQTEFSTKLEARDKRIQTLTESLQSLTSRLEDNGVIDKKPEPLARGTLTDGFDIPRPQPEFEPETEPEPPEPTPIVQVLPREPIPETITATPEPEPVIVETHWYNRPAARLGELAVVAALAAGAAILISDEINEDGPKPVPAPVVVHAPKVHLQSNSQAGASILESNGYHLSFFNKDKNRQRTGVWLPGQLKLAGSPGNYSITNSQGQILVRRAQWDSQGKLSKSNVHALKTKYNIAWDRLKNGRYVTVVATR